MGFAKDYIDRLIFGINKIDSNKIEEISEIIYKAGKENKQIFIIGNGGSAATASHFACDLGKGTLRDIHDDQEERFRVISF